MSTHFDQVANKKAFEINMTKPCEDFFECRFFQVWENDVMKQDLLPMYENSITYQ